MKPSIPVIPVQQARLYEDVLTLTSIQPPRHYLNLDSLNAIAGYIAHELGKLNCKVEYQKYKAQGREYKNVIATFGDVSKQMVVVGAHYDVCGDQPGADDNASAVAGLLELARLVNELQPALSYGVEFVAYCLEEPPFFATPFMGSFVHASSLKETNTQVKAMICLEMIGYFSDEQNSQHFPVNALRYVYPTTGNFITVVGKLSQLGLIQKVAGHMREVSTISVQSFSAPKLIPAISLSDHRSYWQCGYPAVMINNTSFYRNPHYHQPTDTIDTLDFDKMEQVVKGVYWAMVNI
ncbi:M28 family peptidase [Rhodocytophaga rosea]|uniref:M28 family peptidase n=1 Tax=Rhodocytophaga rosea TaxID=2704465 RepID=A0A6C0GMA6_9BACT|nr:M28 family peptidase [Rhodocytophaga rosea]QHT68954.1 M28 family peptidase [Rhodocytophaga rosea]